MRHIKSLLTVGLSGILAFSLFVVPASAHHHGGYGHGSCGTVYQPSSSQTETVPSSYSVCPVEGCTVAGHHSHYGTTYCGYPHESGFCDNTCCPLCPVEGCSIPGRHSHDGTTYCGNWHNGGFCDSNCATADQRWCRPSDRPFRYGHHCRTSAVLSSSVDLIF